MTVRTYADEHLIEHVLYDETCISARVAELASSIRADYDGTDLRLITLLRGGVFFLADLSRALNIDHTIDFMSVSAYAGGRGVARITKDLDDPIHHASVLVVEDIIDTGLTLSYVLNVLRQRGPSKLSVCTLMDKGARRIADLPIDYTGFVVPDRFLVGYGLDYKGRYRNLPYVGTLNEDALT